MQQRVTFLTLCALISAAVTPLTHAANLERSTITEVVADVTIIDPVTKSQRPAKANEVFSSPSIMRTGPNSRAELIADDKTVTRVGANTMFSFEPNKREINLQRGSVLFNSPTGKGGGTIKTASATAAVLGTTLIVLTTPNGGFKVMLLEGKGKVDGKRGGNRTLKAGQMSFVLPGQMLGPIYNYQLREQVNGSKLVGGFKNSLPSLAKIEAAIRSQMVAIDAGELETTGLLAGEEPGQAFQIDSAILEALFEDYYKELLGEDSTDGTDQSDPSDPNSTASAELFATALATDAIIDGFELNAEYLFALSHPEAVKLGADANFIGNDGLMFLANSISIETPEIDTSFLDGTDIRLIAVNDISIAGPLTITSSGQVISLIAGGTFNPASGTVITADTSELSMIAYGSTFDFSRTDPTNPANFSDTKPLNLVNFAVINNLGDIRLAGPSMTLDTTGFSAAGALTINSHGDIMMKDNITEQSAWAGQAPGAGMPANPAPTSQTAFSARGTAFEAGTSIDITSARNFDATNSDFVSPNTSLTSGDNMKLSLVRFGDDSFSGSGTVNLKAVNNMNVFDATFRAANVNMSAHTINIVNTDFAAGSTVTLKSQSGNYNINPNPMSPPPAGDVNFINSTYGGSNPIVGGPMGNVGSSSNPNAGPIQVQKR